LFFSKFKPSFLRREDIIGNTSMQQLLYIVLSGINGTEVRANGLPLDSQLDLLAGNGFTH